MDGGGGGPFRTFQKEVGGGVPGMAGFPSFCMYSLQGCWVEEECYTGHLIQCNLNLWLVWPLVTINPGQGTASIGSASQGDPILGGPSRLQALPLASQSGWDLNQPCPGGGGGVPDCPQPHSSPPGPAPEVG